MNEALGKILLYLIVVAALLHGMDRTRGPACWFLTFLLFVCTAAFLREVLRT